MVCNPRNCHGGYLKLFKFNQPYFYQKLNP